MMGGLVIWTLFLLHRQQAVSVPASQNNIISCDSLVSDFPASSCHSGVNASIVPHGCQERGAIWLLCFCPCLSHQLVVCMQTTWLCRCIHWQQCIHLASDIHPLSRAANSRWNALWALGKPGSKSQMQLINHH